jgi:hypothetical protein
VANHGRQTVARSGDAVQGGDSAALRLVEALSARRAIVRLCERPANVVQPVLKIVIRENSLAKPVIESYRNTGQDRKGPHVACARSYGLEYTASGDKSRRRATSASAALIPVAVNGASGCCAVAWQCRMRSSFGMTVPRMEHQEAAALTLPVFPVELSSSSAAARRDARPSDH